MSSDKLKNIYQLLTEYNFDANKNIPDEFNCGKCRKILIKACQTRCGCRFCRSCVDEMINNGCQFCPGITNYCKIELLSTVQLDYRANNQISKLIMKCPVEMCSFECELLEMSEHLRICGKKIMGCPVYKLDCNTREMTNEKLIEYFQLEIYNQNKILIDMMDNIKNEIEELREKELKNHEEINKLKTDLQLKDEKLESINAQMEMIKMEKLEMEKRLKNVEGNQNVDFAKLKSEHEKEMQSINIEIEELDDQMQIGLRNIWCKIDEIKLELKKRYENGKIESIKSELIEKIETLQRNFDNKIDEIESTKMKEIKSIRDEMKSEVTVKFFQEVCEQTINKSINQMGIEQKINYLERNVEKKMNGILEMMIDNFDELENKTLICSEYFYVRMHPYKLRLLIDPSSNNDQSSICLCIYDDLENQYLKFPFKADVTIKFINKNKREVSKTIMKYCQLGKPRINSSNLSDKFNYSKSELIESGILESNCFIIECCVELK